MQNRIRFRHLALALPVLMGLGAIVTTAGCGSEETKVETAPGPSAEEQQAQDAYSDMMKGKKPGTVVK